MHAPNRYRIKAIKTGSAALLLTLAACNQSSEENQQSSSASQTEQIESSASDVPHSAAEDAQDSKPNKILDGGFYSDADPTTGEKPLAENKEPSAKDEEQTSNNPTALIEDLGFSGAEPELIDNNKEEERYCLSEPAPADALPKEICERISTRLASVKLKSCNAARLTASGCRSVKGFPILVREFPPVAERAPKGRILIIGGTHGDELTSVSVSLRWIEKLNQHHSGLFHWHIAPLMNPDGVLKRAASRTNDNGVDLNRNMPSDDWTEKAIKYWQHKGGKDPRKFPGEQAASEPETQWLIDEINTFKPDAIVSIHAPYGVVDFDSLLLNTAPKSLGKLHLNLLGTYPGSLGNYAGINRNIPVITLELPHSWVMPSEKETTKIWEDLVSWLQKNINNELASNSD